MVKDQRFAIFYKKYFNYVLAIASRYIPQRHDLEDVVSEVFFNLWLIFDEIDEKSNIKSLVYLITKRKIYDFLRKRYKVKEHEISLDQIEDTISQDLKVYQDDRGQLKNFVWQIVQKLPDKYQNFYKWRYQKNYTYRQIAKQMQITLNNAKILNNRLIKQIKSIWTKKIQ